LHGGESSLFSTKIRADIRNGTGGLAKSGKTAVDYGVINLKYGVYHIDTAQVSVLRSGSINDKGDVLMSRDTVPRKKLGKLLTLLMSRGILFGLLPRVRLPISYLIVSS
jgi:hypothetical protein